MGPGCGPGCRYKCKSKFTGEARYEVFKRYWKLGDNNRQRDFINKNVECRLTERRKRGCSRRKNSYFWHLEDDQGVRQRVCKTYFLDTLDVSNKTIDTTIGKKASGVVESDQRGRHVTRPNRIKQEVRDDIRQHIASFPKVPSHYLRKDSTREYLEDGMTLAKMYKLYVAKCNERGKTPGKKWLYENIFSTEFNLSFFKPKRDQCDFCEGFKNSSPEEKAEKSEKYDEHISNKEEARNQKNKDKAQSMDNKAHVTACYDLQKVLPLPKGEVSLFYYARKLACFNFTIFNLENRDGHCYMWNETISGRGANEIGSCIYAFLEDLTESRMVEDVVFYSDNCPGQNRNKYIAAMYLKAVASTNIQRITHKFLERGHTQNEGDSMHATIEKAIGKNSVYTPDQYYMIARTARQTPYKVHEMQDFYNFKTLTENYNNWTIDETGKKVSWKVVRVLEVRKDDPNTLYYKNNYCDEFTRIRLNRAKRGGKGGSKSKDLENEILHPLNTSGASRPISDAKYNDLIGLCRKQAIPKAYQQFYHQLPHNTVGAESDSE